MRIGFKLGLAGLFVVNVFLLGLLTGGVSRLSAAGEKTPPPCDVGDVSGDGAVSLFDAVYLLNYLFLEGPSPVACAGPPEEPPLREEFAAALAQFMPRYKDRVSTLVTPAAINETLSVLTVPDGKRFVIADAYGLAANVNGGGVSMALGINGVIQCSIQGGDAPWVRQSGNVLLIAEPGDTIEVLTGSSNAPLREDSFVRLFGYYVDAE